MGRLSFSLAGVVASVLLDEGVLGGHPGPGALEVKSEAPKGQCSGGSRDR